MWANGPTWIYNATLLYWNIHIVSNVHIRKTAYKYSYVFSYCTIAHVNPGESKFDEAHWHSLQARAQFRNASVALETGKNTFRTGNESSELLCLAVFNFILFSFVASFFENIAMFSLIVMLWMSFLNYILNSVLL